MIWLMIILICAGIIFGGVVLLGLILFVGVLYILFLLAVAGVEKIIDIALG